MLHRIAVIALSRTACFGSCPQYRVELRGTGEVIYRGDSDVLVTGLHRWRVDPKSIATLLDLFERAHYFNLNGYYEFEVSDLPTYITRLSLGKQDKFVLDYGGSGFGGAVASTSFGGADPHMPPIVTELEDSIDKIAATASWVRGDEHTLERLRTANWNFRSQEAGQGLALLLSACNTVLAREFIRAGAPVRVISRGWNGGVPIAAAARCDDVGLVRLMMSRGALDRKADAKSFLEASVESGYPDMVAIALTRYPNANIKDQDGMPLIARAAGAYVSEDNAARATFDSAKVIALLVEAGADANARDANANTPLFEANDAAVARALIKAGADPGARNANGQTPLFDRYFDEPKKVMIEAGADVNARDKFGRTAIFYQDHTDSLRLLIEAGADVDAEDAQGLTAIEEVNVEVAASTLLEAGARLPADPSRLNALAKKASDRKWATLLPRLEVAATNKH